MKKLLLLFFALLWLGGAKAESIFVGAQDGEGKYIPKTDRFWQYFSPDYIMVKGDKWHFVIKNYNNEDQVWDNVATVFTNDVNKNDTGNGYVEHLVLRNDRQIENGNPRSYWGDCVTRNAVTVTDTYSETGLTEETFPSEMNGATLDITVSYDEDGTFTIDENITLISGKKFQRKAVCTGINNVVRLFFTMEDSYIEIREAQKVQSKYIGSMDKDNGWWRCHSDLYTLQAGKTAHLKFKTHADQNNNAYNWNLIAYNGTGHPLTQGDGYQEYFVVRNDQHTVTGGTNVQFRNTIKYYNNGVGQSIDQNWATYREDCQDADVEMYITFSGGKINVNAWTTRGDHVYTYGFTYTANIEAETITYAFTPERAYMSDFEILANDLTTIGAADCTSAWTKEYNEATATSKHTLTDGQSYRYKFINVNKPGDIWNNTMVRAFKDNDELKVSLRLDNWEDITASADRIRMSNRNSLESIHAAVIDMVATYKGTPGVDGKLYISERILDTNGTTEHYYQFQKTTSGNTICLQTHSNYFILLEEGVPTEEQINNVYELPYKAKVESYYTSHNELDEAGKAAYDAACTKTTYPMLYDDVDNDVRANYIVGVKAQTTPKSDMTKAVVNAAGNESCGWDVPVNGWTAETTYSRDFHGNNWSTEEDGTGMIKPFLEYWQSKGNNLRDANIKHDAISGLHAGWYRVSALIRAFNEDSNELPTGFSLYANEAISTTEGTEGTYVSSKIVYGTYTVDVYLNGEEDLVFGVKVENANFNWIAFKNFTLTYLDSQLESVTLADNAVNSYAYATYETVNLTRTIKAGWNTICLPFATTAEEVAGEGAVAYAFTEATADNELTFGKVDNMEANVPYLFYCENETVNPSFNNVTLYAAEPATVEQGNWKFIGNYTPKMNMNGKYGVTGDKVRLAGSGSTLNGMRAYLEGPANAQASVKVNKFDTEETGIILTPAALEEMNSEQVIYDLSGRRVSKTQKGIYIINGKKVIK